MDTVRMPTVIEFICASCGILVTRPLRSVKDMAAVSLADGSPLVPTGTFLRTVGGEPVNLNRRGAAGTDFVCVNLRDVVNIRHVSDRARLNGCCGLDGLDGPNVECVNGHEIGTEISDCWTPHFLYFEPEAVKPAPVYTGEVAP